MSAPKAVLAIDQGTTGSTALVVAQDGRIMVRSYSEFEQHFPRPGWVEHDPEEIWRVTVSVARRAIQEVDGRVAIHALGITNQRETVMLWDRETLEPTGPAIVWQDRRTADICRELREAGHESDIRDRSGLLLDPYFSGTKLLWLFRQEPELLRRAEAGELAMGTMDSWLITRLTGGRVHATDPTNASRTLLFNLRERSWDPLLLDLLGVPEAVLPEVRRSSGNFGSTDGGELGVELPIGGVAGDQQSALFGQGCWAEGLAKNTYGTGAFLLLNTGRVAVPSEAGLLTTIACDGEGGPAYALEGSVFIAGAALQWLRDGIGILGSAKDSEGMARSLESNEGVYFVPAFVGLGAPYWDPEARGTMVGLTRGTTRAHLARAALEAMAYGVADVLRAMGQDSGIETQELRVDGGAAENDWLMEFQANVLGVPVRRPGLVETTALGAAGLAGLSESVWTSGSEFLEALGETKTFSPGVGDEERERCLAGWRRAVATARAWSGWEDTRG